YIAPLLGFRVPVRNDFLLQVLASLIPCLMPDFLRFSDDYVILRPMDCQQLCTIRALADLNSVTERRPGKWRELLWRTYEVLKQYGYAGYNFEAHVPQPLTKQLVFETFMAFREFVSEERNAGLLSGTSIYNYGLKHHGLSFVWIAEERSKAGFYGGCPAEAEIAQTCSGKFFLNFDDKGFDLPMQ